VCHVVTVGACCWESFAGRQHVCWCVSQCEYVEERRQCARVLGWRAALRNMCALALARAPLRVYATIDDAGLQGLQASAGRSESSHPEETVFLPFFGASVTCGISNPLQILKRRILISNECG
jgi:hypothetical protein